MTTMLFGSQRPVEGLTVVGEATRDAPPEIVEFYIDVHSAAPTAAMATQENANKIMQIRQALTLAGNDQVDLLAGATGVWPILQSPAIPGMFMPRPPLLSPPVGFAAAPLTPMPAGMPDGPSLLGYHAFNSVKVTVRDSLQLGEVIDAISRSGALPSGSVRFLARNEAELRRNLLEEAIQDARGKANTLAAASGRSTGNAVSISEDFAAYQPQYFYGNGYRANPFGVNTARLPFLPGQLTFSARVFVTYQLQ